MATGADAFEAQSVNLSRSGMLLMLAENEERPLPIDTQIIADFRVKSQAIIRDFRLVTNVVREFRKSVAGVNTRFAALSFNTPEFDEEDRRNLIEFVLHFQIENYTQHTTHQ